jgi:hypothetical protein
LLERAFRDKAHNKENEGKELLTLGGRNVKVTGVVGEEVDGWKTITVTAYAVIE